MTRALSVDLREMAVGAIASGLSRIQAAARFDVERGRRDPMAAACRHARDAYRCRSDTRQNRRLKLPQLVVFAGHPGRAPDAQRRDLLMLSRWLGGEQRWSGWREW